MTDGPLERLLVELGAAYLRPEAMEGFVERIDDAIVEQAPLIAADPELRRDLHASTRAQLLAFAAAFVTGNEHTEPPPEAVALARTVARRGLELRVLLNVYGAGRQAALRLLNEEVQVISEDAETKLALLVHVWGTTMRWLERSTDFLVSAYSAEREVLLRGALARRSELVGQLLSGARVDVEESSRVLDYPLRRHHVAYVLWADDSAPQDDSGIALERAARAVGAALGAQRTLLVPSGARGLWVWASVPQPPVLDRLGDALAQHPGLRVAVGAAGPGVAGFARSHQEALAAQRTAVLADGGQAGGGKAGGGKALTRYDEVEIATVMSSDLDGVRALVRRELRGLAVDEPRAGRLRETVRVYLEHNGKQAAAASALGVHKNTVQYRLGQAAELLGHPVDERRLPVELALVCVATFGALVLPAGG